MTRIRLLTLPAVLVLLGLAAVPAQATLLIKSDGNGLLVQDKNNLDDDLDIGTGSHAGQPGQYLLTNRNGLDFDKFDTRLAAEANRPTSTKTPAASATGPR